MTSKDDGKRRGLYTASQLSILVCSIRGYLKPTFISWSSLLLVMYRMTLRSDNFGRGAFLDWRNDIMIYSGEHISMMTSGELMIIRGVSPYHGANYVKNYI